MKKLRIWFGDLKVTSKVVFIGVLAVVFFGVVGVSAQPGSSSSTTVQSSTSTVPTSKVEVKTETTTEGIPYTSSTIQDGTLDQGVTQVRTKGVNGVLTHTYQVTYTNGTETDRSAAVDTVSTPAINEVIVEGTKVPAPVCENGTYINSAGNTVCSPESSSSVPAGATARCSDQTYSFSQSRSGTCSHHGGVASWL